MRKKGPGRGFALCFVFIFACLNGCSKPSYPGDKLKEALSEICQKEYGIHQIEVKVIGKTIGVYLPLEKLFLADFKEVIKLGKIQNIDKLFEPSPEAFDKIENVLFSISRVLLSTDRPLDFYVLQATDVAKTGQQLTITGYVNDIRRVRIWDISRDEYRKRIVSEWGYNRAVLWNRPVRQFFKDLGHLTVQEINQEYFNGEVTDEEIQNLFMNRLLSDKNEKNRTRWEFLELKGIPISKSEVVIYARVKPVWEPGPDSRGKEETPELKYLMLIAISQGEPKLMRVIPFQYLDSQNALKKIPLPKELQFEDNVHWQEEFHVEEVFLGPFLANQLTRRLQMFLSTDERVHNTFKEIKLSFQYHPAPPPSYFSLEVSASPKSGNPLAPEPEIPDDDMSYVLNLASRQFVDVLRSYQFDDYEYLKLNLPRESAPWLINREGLELFRRKKIDFQGLLSPA